jgi:hypothetical protein
MCTKFEHHSQLELQWKCCTQLTFGDFLGLGDMMFQNRIMIYDQGYHVLLLSSLSCSCTRQENKRRGTKWMYSHFCGSPSQRDQLFSILLCEGFLMIISVSFYCYLWPIRSQHVSCAAMISEVIMKEKSCLTFQETFLWTIAKCPSHHKGLWLVLVSHK